MKNALSAKILTTSFAISSFLSFATQVGAQTPWVQQEGRTCVSPEGVATFQGIECLMANILSVATTFIGLAAFVMFIVGAFLYLTSGSSTKGAEAARQTMTYAIIGIVVALIATFLLNFVAGFTGVGGILQFNLNIGN